MKRVYKTPHSWSYIRISACSGQGVMSGFDFTVTAVATIMKRQTVTAVSIALYIACSSVKQGLLRHGLKSKRNEKKYGPFVKSTRQAAVPIHPGLVPGL